MKKTRREKKEIRAVIIRIIIGICFIFPLLIAFVFSFVPDEKLYGLPSLSTIIETFTIDNYKWVLTNVPILRYVGNSLVMCLIVIVSSLLIASLAAYAFSFLRFKGKDFLFSLILVAMMIPGQVVTIANFLTIRGMGLVNTYLGLSLPFMIGGTAVFLMRQSYLSLPKEIKEASLIDGCGEWNFLFHFAIPLSKPSLASLAIMTFIDIFNAYFWPLLVSRDKSMFTIQIGIATLNTAEVPTYGKLLAGAVLALILPIGMFIIGQDYIVKGMTAGSVKG